MSLPICSLRIQKTIHGFMHTGDGKIMGRERRRDQHGPVIRRSLRRISSITRGLPHSLSKFVEWLEMNDCMLHESLRFVNTGESSTFASRSVIVGDGLIIGKGEILFRLPKHVILSVENSELGEEVYSWGFPGEWDPLIVCMMYEYSTHNSFWKPYLDVLPHSIDSPQNWNDEELEELKGTSIEDSIAKYEIISSFETDVKRVLMEHKEVFPIEWISLDLYMRMGSLVMAYSFCDESSVFMAPMADMLNHRTGHNNARLFFGEKGEFCMCSTKRCASGSEIYNTYGELSNGELLRKYGFVDEENVNDVVEVDYECVVGELEKLSRHPFCDIVEKLDLDGNSFIIEKEDMSIPDELLLVGKIACLSDAEAEMIVEKDVDDTICVLNEKDPPEVISKVLQKRMKMYPTSIEYDEELLERGDIPYRMRMAVTVRLGEKYNLREILENC